MFVQEHELYLDYFECLPLMLNQLQLPIWWVHVLTTLINQIMQMPGRVEEHAMSKEEGDKHILSAIWS